VKRRLGARRRQVGHGNELWPSRGGPFYRLGDEMRGRQVGCRQRSAPSMVVGGGAK
jgi:hypothetical protein